MPALNFTVFIDKILSGEKCQTIRQVREKPIKPGDRLFLYTGMMHKGCRKLGEAVCRKIIPVKFNYEDLFGDGSELSFFISSIKTNKPWPLEWQNGLAKDDGFDSWNEFVLFFLKTYKLKPGDVKRIDIIEWVNFKPEVK